MLLVILLITLCGCEKEEDCWLCNTVITINSTVRDVRSTYHCGLNFEQISKLEKDLTGVTQDTIEYKTTCVYIK